jgi:hypothetical protein
MTESSTQQVPARLEEQVEYVPLWTTLLGPVQTFVALLPSYRSTNAGRQTATQIRAVAFVVGATAMIFGGSVGWVLVGGLFAASALVIPLPESRKRSLQTRLKALRGPRQRTDTRSGQLVYDGRRVILKRGGEKLRRVLIDGDEIVEFGAYDGRLAVKLAPPSGRKSDTIWIVHRDRSIDFADAGDPPIWETEHVDRPALVDADGFSTVTGWLDADRPALD